MSKRPVAGVGIGLRREHFDAILATERRVDWLEIVPEGFIGMGGRPARVLDQCVERWPIVPHSVSLSLGGPDPLDEAFLAGLGTLADRLDAPFVSDHVCYARAGGSYLFDLLPLPFTPEAVEHLVARIRAARARIGRPVVVENITYYAVMPGSTMREGEFLRAVLDGADCGLLLDLNNVYLNAVNHGREPSAVLDDLPLERTRQIHLAGFRREGDVLLDDHASAVAPEVWDLYRAAITRLGPVPTLVEWDQRVPPLERVLDEADTARKIMGEAAAARSLPESGS